MLCDKTKETCATFLNHMEDIIHPSFLARRMVGGDDPFNLKFWTKLGVGAKTPIFNRYSLVARQP